MTSAVVEPVAYWVTGMLALGVLWLLWCVWWDGAGKKVGRRDPSRRPSETCNGFLDQTPTPWPCGHRGGCATVLHMVRSESAAGPSPGRVYVSQIVGIGQRWRRKGTLTVYVVYQVHRKDRMVDLFKEGDDPARKGAIMREKFVRLGKYYTNQNNRTEGTHGNN